MSEGGGGVSEGGGGVSEGGGGGGGVNIKDYINAVDINYRGNSGFLFYMALLL